MEFDAYHPASGDGWRLYVRRATNPARFNPDLRPLAIVPGYGMNSYIFGWHPRGESMIDYLTDAGFEVWTMNFRCQDQTVNEGGRRRYGFADIVLRDLPAAIGCIMEHTRSRRDRLDIIGCSLGGTYLYAYLVMRPDNPLGNVVAMGAPLRWDHVHPIFRVLFAKPKLLGLLALRGTRTLARCALPIAAKIPGFLHIYLHPKSVDLSKPDMLVKTVEDPNPQLNEEIARWMLAADLIIDGVNVSEGMAAVTNPLYLMLACADGIVPEATALSAARLAASTVKDVITVGDADYPMAHADMFISDEAHQRVFVPLADWLVAHQDGARADQTVSAPAEPASSRRKRRG